MTAKKIHLVVKHGRGCSISTLWPHAIASDFLPHIRLEVVLVQVIAIVAIIAAENVHVIFIDDAGM